MLNNDYGVHGNIKLDIIFMVSEKMIATNNARRKEGAFQLNYQTTRIYFQCHHNFHNVINIKGMVTHGKC